MRALNANEIDVRVGQVGENYVSLLLYKDARVDRQILDEEFGIYGWQCDYKELKGNMYCGIGVYDSNMNQWVWKWDCGVESQTEREKGEASDAFKRAGFRWGIGIELYSSPRIYLNGVGTEPIGNNKFKIRNPRELSNLYVSLIHTEDGKVQDLDIAQRRKNRPSIVIWSTNKRKEGLEVNE